MRLSSQWAIVTLFFCALAGFGTAANTQFEETSQSNESADEHVNRCEMDISSRGLTPNDGLAVIAAALDRRTRLYRRDCSHLVHAIYRLAGFPYPYASSSELYAGSNDFEQVTEAQPGDLVVWHGHVGIVVNPTQHIFFSTLRLGPGIDSYDAPHWKRRGQVRFFRYLKKCAAPDVQNHLLVTHQER